MSRHWARENFLRACVRVGMVASGSGSGVGVGAGVGVGLELRLGLALGYKGWGTFENVLRAHERKIFSSAGSRTNLISVWVRVRCRVGSGFTQV